MQTAYQFALTLLEQKHHIKCIFFTEDAVYQALEKNSFWTTLAPNVPLWLCSSACEMRGLLKDIPAPFVISGLGELMQAFLISDQIMTFP